MRQAINNLQSTHYGFGYVNAENVFKVCDQPHPVLVQHILQSCAEGNVTEADRLMRELYDSGYASLDIITTVFRVIKSFDKLDEALRLDFLKVPVWMRKVRPSCLYILTVPLHLFSGNWVYSHAYSRWTSKLSTAIWTYSSFMPDWQGTPRSVTISIIT